MKAVSCFLITVDTEGDNLWRNMSSRNSVEYRHTVSNGRYLPRFQQLAERYGFVPTYFVDYEMSYSPDLIDMASCAAGQGRLEIGMHMHAWTCPPWYGLKGEISNPYITEYPKELVSMKVKTLTDRLREAFHRDITSARSGCWGINEDYVDALLFENYIADCSVTPGIDWREDLGQTGCQGPDYSKSGKQPYILKQDGKRTLFEIPVTIGEHGARKIWLRPNGSNLQEMKALAKAHQQDDYLEFMIHSSELMPWGSPSFRSKFAIEKLYLDMEDLFSYLRELGFRGCGVSAYAERLKGKV